MAISKGEMKAFAKGIDTRQEETEEKFSPFITFVFWILVLHSVKPVNKSRYQILKKLFGHFSYG